MQTLAVTALFALAGHAAAADLSLDAAAVVAPAWRADGVSLVFAPPHDLQLRIAAIAVAGHPVVQEVQLRCRRLRVAPAARCDDAGFSATLAGGGRLHGRLQARFDHPHRWHARLDATRLRLVLDQDGDTLTGDVTVTGLSYGEPTGRYAAEALAAKASWRWDGRRLDLSLDSHGGAAYAEPLYFDFTALPLQVTTVIHRAPPGWRIERLRAAQGRAGSLELSGLLDGDFRAARLDARLEAPDLGPLVATAIAPFLLGTRLDGTRASGAAAGSLAVRDGALHRVTAQVTGMAVSAPKLGVALEDIAGELDWSASAASASRLEWRGGAVGRVPLGPSSIAFVAHGRNFALTGPWRQPLLGGALEVARLALRDIGGAQPAAEFDGAVEPVDLAALCQALGWPEFGGTLGGRLAGLTLRDEVWSIDGALEAQAFDGSIHIGNLRVIEPFGLLPRLEADLRARRLDLERVTGALSFGRITGRLDGEVTGLRLLDWSPVAFDARLYSTPGYGGSRRISQRAIDSISTIGGGPTGLASRGFLSLFQDFAYAQLGIGCVLRDGVCEMEGVEPAKSKEGARAYYLVKGRLLPRIDVVGYARRVSWSTLIEQLKAAQASAGPEVRK